uniref:Phage protein n=1 Tax=uncultured bacterium Contig643 TaxID=1393602 RepID=W0FHA8_9BACT|nr:hypothetical protein [uncultured bacterium Contig643]
MSNSVLDRIKKTLTTLSDGEVKMEGVWYGACRVDKLDHWNYFVFNRKKTTKDNKSHVDMQTFYEVHVIHEDYIPEGYIGKVIEALQQKDESGTKLRMTDDDIAYDYTFKGNTDMVVEIATITIYHPQKRC